MNRCPACRAPHPATQADCYACGTPLPSRHPRKPWYRASIGNSSPAALGAVFGFLGGLTIIVFDWGLRMVVAAAHLGLKPALLPSLALFLAVVSVPVVGFTTSVGCITGWITGLFRSHAWTYDLSTDETTIGGVVGLFTGPLLGLLLVSVAAMFQFRLPQLEEIDGFQVALLVLFYSPASALIGAIIGATLASREHQLDGGAPSSTRSNG
jgi:hypothetical protein